MKNLIMAFIALALSSCSSVHHKRADILDRKDSIAVLQGKIEKALLADVNILAPESFSKTKNLLDKAMREAQRSTDSIAGNQTAVEGLAALEKAEKISEETRPILSHTLEKRTRARAAQAHILFPQEYAKLDQELTYAARALEEGRHQEGIGKNAALATAFENLEMKAVKESVVSRASSAYDEAVRAHALRLAPITMQKAKSEIDIAKQIIEVEKDNREKATFHGRRALYFALQAKNIADTLIAFNKERLTDERKVLWFQDQLSQVHKAHSPDGVSFDKANREVVAELEEKVASLVAKVRNLKETNIAAGRKIVEKEHALAEQARPDAVFEKITSLFTKEEAEVLKRDEDIIIRSYGFNFPVNKAELLTSNFTLLKKIVEAIDNVPSAQIEVEGHTDSSGSARLNLNLSKKRAQNIADYLIKVAGIDEGRVVAIGFGFEKPLAGNKTQVGREKNRRIEVVIKNNP